MTNLYSILKNRDITLPTKVHIVKAMVFPGVMYGCESWIIKKAESWRIRCFWTAMLEKTLESPLDIREIKPVSHKGNQPWIFTGKTSAEDKAPILWPSDVKSQLIGKDPEAGKRSVQEEKWVTEDEMIGWHHQMNGHKCEQALRDSEGQGSLACFSLQGHKESDTI